jgi:ferredoxin
MKVRITEDCIACGLCVDICPDVFEMGEKFAQVKKDCDLDKHKDLVNQAVEECPVSAIIVED